MPHPVGIANYSAAILTFDKMSISPEQTTGYCKTVFSLHVVESASDDYNF